MERIIVEGGKERGPSGRRRPPRHALLLLGIGFLAALSLIAPDTGPNLRGKVEDVPPPDAPPPLAEIAAAEVPERPRRTSTASFTIGGFSECNPQLQQRLVTRQSAVVPPPLESVAAAGWQMADLSRSACRTGVRLVDLTLGWQGLVAAGSHDVDGRRHAMVWTSRDGLTWLLEPDRGAFADADRDLEISGVGAIQGSIVAVGRACDVDAGWECEAALWHAPLGEPWERVDPISAGFAEGAVPHGVETVAGGLVAFGRSGPGAAIWTSADGVQWTTELETNGRRRIHGVTGLDDGTMVAWGTYIGSRFDRHTEVWVRAEPGMWEEIEYDRDVFGGPLVFAWFPAVSEIVGAGGEFFAVGRFADLGGVRAIWQSNDGRSWKLVETGDEGSLDHVAQLGTRLTAWTRGEGPTVVSSDGVEWAEAEQPVLSADGATRRVVRSLIGVTALVDAGSTQLWTLSSGRL